MDTAFLYLQDTLVELIINVLSVGKLKVSSNDAMSNGLTDGSTETFSESHDALFYYCGLR